MNADKRRFLKLILLLAFVLNFAPLIQAQKVKPKAGKTPSVAVIAAQIEDRRLNSKLMAREMPYQVIYPGDYHSEKSKTRRYAVVYLLHGLTGHFDNWSSKTKIADYAKQYNFIIVTPEGANGWYTDSGSENNDRYESYIIEELIPEVDKNFRTVAASKYRFVAGLSMGGYGAIKFGLRRPDLFALVGSFSGALGAADWTEKEIGSKGAIAESILKVYGAAGSQTRKENDIFQMIREVPAERVKELPFIYLDCGTEDFLIQNNLDFVKLLREKKIPHEFRELPGKHDWKYWDSQVQEFLRLSERFLK